MYPGEDRADERPKDIVPEPLDITGGMFDQLRAEANEAWKIGPGDPGLVFQGLLYQGNPKGWLYPNITWWSVGMRALNGDDDSIKDLWGSLPPSDDHFTEQWILNNYFPWTGLFWPEELGRVE